MNKFIFSLIIIFYLIPLTSCTSSVSKNEPPEPPLKDLHSFANFSEIDFKHLTLDLIVSFEDKSIGGSATWDYKIKNNTVNYLTLDTRDLLIEKVIDQDGNVLRFELENPVEYLGQALNIEIKETEGSVQVFYKTKSSSEALQWLSPEQTFGKQQPFLYTQSETIYARSWIPSPDGPGIRFTYEANIQVPQGMLALMSAPNPQKTNSNGLYEFKMEQPIPAYLLALAVGNISFKAIDERTGVYAEPTLLKDAWEEFKDIGSMVKVAETLYGPYQWERYDLLALPFGFPFGGMENPILTFLTPTIISGDKSLLNLVAHELAHSWSGNLVTNQSWEDFWLNEGFTVYFERRITEAIHGKDYADMLWSLAFQDLQSSIHNLPERDTWLKLSLKDRHPDVGLTDIAYEKGALFLRQIEETIGREEMDHFFNKYFADHAFKTMNTEQFITYFNENIISKNKEWEKSIQLHSWIFGPGIPNLHPQFKPNNFLMIDPIIEAVHQNNDFIDEINTSDWSTYEYLYFLKGIQPINSFSLMEKLDKAWDLTHHKNMEILCLWLVLSIEQEYKPAYSELDQFLSQVGRMKFLEPIYEALSKSSLGLLGTQKLYKQKANNYHPIAQMEIKHILKIK